MKWCYTSRCCKHCSSNADTSGYTCHHKKWFVEYGMAGRVIKMPDVDLTLTGFDPTEIAKLTDLTGPVKDIDGQYDIALNFEEDHDYIVLVFNNTIDFVAACDMLGVKRVKEEVRGRVGLGRAVDGSAFLSKVRGKV